MPLKKLQFRPGINKEVTAYSAEGGWVDADRVRFRQGYPETIGGWQRFSSNSFLGTCRSLIEWSTLGAVNLYGIGTHLKYYVSRGSDYADITPIRAATGPGGAAFSASNGSSTLTVSDVAHGARTGDFVVFSGAVSLGGNVTAAVLNREYQITNVLNADTYTVTMAVTANASDTGNGGASVVATYQISIGPETNVPLTGWGTGGWGIGPWGIGTTGSEALRIWNHANYGEDLIFGPRGGRLYYFDSSLGIASSNRGTLITGSAVPVVHKALLVSDVSRFVIAMGCNEIGSSDLDPMLVRWSEQEDYTDWAPAATNQAGGQRLSTGSKIITGRQGRQEILIWTDTALYAMQYLGPPLVWGFQLMGENISIASPGAVTLARGTAFWMGRDKFYRYDGRVSTQRCDLRRYVFGDINFEQIDQVVCGTNEGFNEVWWFYPSSGSTMPNRYVVYNYEEDIWHHGMLTRTAWLDSRLRGNPIAAFQGRLLDHETGVNDGSGDSEQPLNAYITSAPVDIDDGDRFAFVRRILPDMTFALSTATAPRVQMTLLPMKSSGQGYSSPASVGGASQRDVSRSVTVPVEAYTAQIDVRVRGRQIALRIDSPDLGVAWQLGSPRIDMRPDGQRG